MKRISEKLKSRGGASLIIALILALVAIFVGGSVLAAATVNGGRLAHRRELQQAYLSQRSAAKLISEELTKNNLALTVLQSGPDDVTVTAVGGVASERNPITELFYETVAYKYLSSQQISITNVTWENFQIDESTARPMYDSAMRSEADYQSELTLSDPSGAGKTLAVRVRVDNDAATDENERFTVYFSFPVDGQLRLKVRALQQHDTETGENRFSWSSPSIIKEGSDN